MEKQFPLWSKFYQQIELFMPQLPEHQYILDKLLDIDISSSPNIILYGSKGFPNSLLIELAISKIKKIPFPIAKRYPLWNDSFSYTETDYYFEINMAHPNFPKDIQVVIDFLLTIIRNKCIHVERHIVILQNIHVLQEHNPQAFRVILERFANNALFIGITTHIHKLEAPLLSRMLMYRIPLPTEEQNLAILHKLINKKQVRYHSRNLVKNIFFNEPSICKQIKEIPIFNYPPIEEITTKKLTKEEIRKLSLKIFQQCTDFSEIVIDLLSTLQQEEEKHSFLKEATNIEYHSVVSDKTKMCFSFELLLNIYQKYKYKEVS